MGLGGRVLGQLPVTAQGALVPWVRRLLSSPQSSWDHPCCQTGLPGALPEQWGQQCSLLFPLRDPASAETRLGAQRAPRGPSAPGPPARTSWPAAARSSAWSASTWACEWVRGPTGASQFPRSPPNNAAAPLPVITSATPSAAATAMSASSSSSCTADGCGGPAGPRGTASLSRRGAGPYVLRCPAGSCGRPRAGEQREARGAVAAGLPRGPRSESEARDWQPMVCPL